MRKKIFLIYFNFQWTKGKEKQQTFRHLSVQQSSSTNPTKHKIFGPVWCVCLRENGAPTTDDDVQIGARRQQQITPTTLGREHFRTNIWSFLVWAHARRKRKRFLCCCCCLPKGEKKIKREKRFYWCAKQGLRATIKTWRSFSCLLLLCWEFFFGSSQRNLSTIHTQVKKKKREKVEGKHLNGENVDEETRIRRENKKQKNNHPTLVSQVVAYDVVGSELHLLTRPYSLSLGTTSRRLDYYWVSTHWDNIWFLCWFLFVVVAAREHVENRRVRPEFLRGSWPAG